MQTDAYLGLDIGGTGAKAGVFDLKGRLLGFGHQTYVPDVSAEGHVEIPVEKIYRAARTAVRRALSKTNCRTAALCISSQGETFVTLDDRDRPLHPAIIWYDSRARRQTAELHRAVRQSEFITEIYTAPKILWLKQHYPALMRKARRYLLIPDYFAYRLTGETVIDCYTADSSGWYVMKKNRIETAVLDALQVRADQVSRVVFSGTPVARLKPDMAAEWGLSPGTLLVAGANDQYAGALGAGNMRPGIVSETSGTCIALVSLTKNKPRRLPSGIFCDKFPITEYFFILAYTKTGGIAMDWFRREFFPSSSWEKMEHLASAVPAGARGVTAFPFFDGIISPVICSSARAAFCKLSLKHTRVDMFRALLESFAYFLRESLEVMEKHGLKIKVIRSIGGGAKNSLWLQIKADVSGLPVEKPAVIEAATLGSAMLAAKGRGEFKSLAEASESLYRVGKVFMPSPENKRRYQELYADYLRLKSRLYGNLKIEL
jgi:xylulokinase